MSFKACVSLFIFILDDLSIGESEVLKKEILIMPLANLLKTSIDFVNMTLDFLR